MDISQKQKFKLSKVFVRVRVIVKKRLQKFYCFYSD